MIEVRLEENKRRAAAYDGDKLVGTCQYRRLFEDVIINVTETDKAYGGQGIARRLVECVLDEAVEPGGDVRAFCSYAQKILDERSGEE